MNATEHDTLVRLWTALAQARSCYDPRLLASAENALVRWYEPRLVDAAIPASGGSGTNPPDVRADLLRLIRSWPGTDAEAFGATVGRDLRLHLADPQAALAAGAPALSSTLRDVMTSPAVTLQAWVRTSDAARVLVENGFTGAPVVDDRGSLIGMVTEADLLRESVSDAGSGGDSRRGCTVGDVMTRRVASLPTTASPAVAATLMLRDHRRSIPVRDGRRVVGVVTRRDLLRAAMAASVEASRAPD